MKRRLFNFVSVLSLLLCVAVVAGWINHRRTRRTIEYSTSARTYIVTVRPMGLYLATGTYMQHYDSPGWSGSHVDKNVVDSGLFASDRHAGGFFWGEFAAFTHGPRPQCTIAYLILPYWLLIAGSAVMPVWAMWRWRRSVYPTGFCPSCGYDLRATPDRCPECGAVPVELKRQATE